MKLEYENINRDDKFFVETISSWYFNEWQIPKAKTQKDLLENQDSNVIFQMMITCEGIPVGTGGLYQSLPIQHKIVKLRNFTPWVALMYTIPSVRGNGFGLKLLNRIEEKAKSLDYTHIYLFTHTAESLYKRNKWTVTDKIEIKGRSVVIMSKSL